MSADTDTLLNELSAALADLGETVKHASAETSSALADVVAALERRKDTDLSEVVKALRALRDVKPPQVTVNVEPTPLQVSVAAPQVHFHAPDPAQSPVTYEIRIQGKHGAPDTVALITRK